VILSYRGTNNAVNWIEDANFEKVAYFRCQGCLIHTGFYLDWLFFEQDFTAKVAALLAKHPSAGITTTGHSLGAAISAICAIELKYAFPGRKVQIHNFGQPRLGNIKLA
jgi:predicted lipase